MEEAEDLYSNLVASEGERAVTQSQVHGLGVPWEPQMRVHAAVEALAAGGGLCLLTDFLLFSLCSSQALGLWDSAATVR